MQRLANDLKSPSLSRTTKTRSPATDANLYEPGCAPTESDRPMHVHEVAMARRCSSAKTAAPQYAERDRLASIKR